MSLGTLEIPLKEFYQLEPGNILDLPNLAPHNVSLLYNNETIGKGELVAMGDMIGVRITELG